MSKTVKKSVRLLAASHALDLSEQRMLLLVACGRGDMAEEQGVTADEYAEAYDTTRQAAYQALKEAAGKLFERRFSWTDEGGKRITHSRWVSEIVYHEGEARVSMHLAPAVQPLLGDLQRAFAAYELPHVAGLSSAYSLRLYEILVAWVATKSQHRVGLEDLRSQLGIEEGKLKAMSDFKRYALDLAVKQINESTDMVVTYEQHKRGRTITGFTFTFMLKTAIKDVKAPPARDPKTVDFISGQTDQENRRQGPLAGADLPLPGYLQQAPEGLAMTGEQRRVFARKLAEYGGSGKLPLKAAGGESMEAYAQRIEEALRDELLARRWERHLRAVGFKEVRAK